MTLDYDGINKEWSKDLDDYYDSSDLINENKKIPKLHHKYYMLYNTYTLKSIKLKNDLKVLTRQKFEYFNGSMSMKDIKDLGWDLQPLKILKADIPRYIESDKDIIDINNKIAYNDVIVKYLEEILRKLNNRTFEIKNHIELLKLQSGVA
jgi:hypothetical protein